jgi:hypothetical protein
MNYHATARGYERIKGLWPYDGVLDKEPSNLLVVRVTEAQSTLTGSNWTLGGRVFWGDEQDPDANEGIILDWAWTPFRELYIAQVRGRFPKALDTIEDATLGTTLYLDLTVNASNVADMYGIDGLYSTGAALVTDRSTMALTFLGSAAVTTGTRFNTYRGLVPGLGPIVGGWQYDDDVYVVRGAYTVQFYDGGQVLGRPIRAGDIVRVPYGSSGGLEYVRVLYVKKEEGFWEDGSAAGYLVLGPSDGNAASSPTYHTDDIRNLADPAIGEDILLKSGTTVLATVETYTSPGYNPHTDPRASVVWKGTATGWEPVNTGWSIRFSEGTNAPNVPYSPLFQNNVVSSVRSSGEFLATSGAQTAGIGGFIDWVNPGNITADDGSYATSNLANTQTTERLFAGFSTSIMPITDARIVGIKVTIQALQTGTGTPHTALVSLRYPNYDLESANLSSLTELGVSADNYTFGGEDDLWGIEEITPEQINSADFGVDITYTNASGATGQVEIDYVSVEVFYVPNKERVYFYSGNVDLTYGDVSAYEHSDGQFSSGLAVGTLYFDIPNHAANDIEGSIGSVTRGFEIRTGPVGTGELVGYVAAPAEYNLLPAWSAMQEAESRYQVIKANFFENDSSEAIYGANGAGPAFTFNSSGFFFIKTPLARLVDKPRHVAFHDNKLALGFGPGFVALSAAGAPNDFFGTTGSEPSLWGVGDKVTGLVSLPGKVLCVLSESSVRTLEGSGEETGTMRVVSASSGAKEYTAAMIGEPVFADNYGVTTLSATDKYGDFAISQLTSAVQSWTRDRVQLEGDVDVAYQGPVAGIAARGHNQYRLFYPDGHILTLFFNKEGAIEPMFMHYQSRYLATNVNDPTAPVRFVPTWIDSSILSTGRERIVMGNSRGEVHVLDATNQTYVVNSAGVVEGVNTPCWIITNPLALGRPGGLSKTMYAEFGGRYPSVTTLYARSDTNYHFDHVSNVSEYGTEVVAGDADDVPYRGLRAELIRPYLPTLTDGATFRLVSLLNGTDPHVLQSLIIRASNAAVNRNRAPKEY